MKMSGHSLSVFISISSFCIFMLWFFAPYILCSIISIYSNPPLRTMIKGISFEVHHHSVCFSIFTTCGRAIARETTSSVTCSCSTRHIVECFDVIWNQRLSTHSTLLCRSRTTSTTIFKLKNQPKGWF